MLKVCADERENRFKILAGDQEFPSDGPKLYRTRQPPTTDMNAEMCLFIRAHFSTSSKLADIVERADGDRYT